jgi:hypothetical protein
MTRSAMIKDEWNWSFEYSPIKTSMPIPLPSPAIPIEISFGMYSLTIRADKNPFFSFYNLNSVHHLPRVTARMAFFCFHKSQNLFTHYLVQGICSSESFDRE